MTYAIHNGGRSFSAQAMRHRARMTNSYRFLDRRQVRNICKINTARYMSALLYEEGERSRTRRTIPFWGYMPSPRSCRVTSYKHRFSQRSCVSPVRIARHDPEALCSSPNGCERGGSGANRCQDPTPCLRVPLSEVFLYTFSSSWKRIVGFCLTLDHDLQRSGSCRARIQQTVATS
jgi:hypothetical protein